MTMRVRVLLSLIVGLATIWLAGCGHYTCGTTFGNSSCTPSGSGISSGNNGIKAFGYRVTFSVNGQTSSGMFQQELDASKGTFVSVTTFVPPVVPPFPSGAVIVGKKFMYVPSSNGQLFGFSIDPATGSLTSVLGSPLTVAGGDSIAANPAGNMIFVGDQAGQQISVFSINTDGSLAPVGTPFATSGVSPAVMATDGLGKFLYATAGTGQIAAFSIGTGGLTAVASSPFTTSNLSTIVGEKSGTYLLGVTGSDGFIHVLGIGAGGAIGPEVSGSPFATTNIPVNLTVHPNGAWLYAFNVDSTGALRPIEGFQLSSVGSGTLPKLTGSPFSNLQANSGPIDQSGQFMFALGITVLGNSAESTVTPYGIDQTTGALSSTIGSEGNAGTGAYVVTDEP